jgi:hypothetical protein
VKLLLAHPHLLIAVDLQGCLQEIAKRARFEQTDYKTRHKNKETLKRFSLGIQVGDDRWLSG